MMETSVKLYSAPRDTWKFRAAQHRHLGDYRLMQYRVLILLMFDAELDIGKLLILTMV